MRFSSSTIQEVILEWKDEYSVGIEDLDSQHQSLLRLINEIRQLADEQGLSTAKCYRMLNEMVRYAEEHFRAEETYFQEYAFPQAEEHIEQHGQFLEDAFSMAQQLEKDILSLRGIAMYLSDWYKDHVLGVDQGYKAFLAEKIPKGPMNGKDA